MAWSLPVCRDILDASGALYDKEPQLFTLKGALFALKGDRFRCMKEATVLYTHKYTMYNFDFNFSSFPWELFHHQYKKVNAFISGLVIFFVICMKKVDIFLTFRDPFLKVGDIFPSTPFYVHVWNNQGCGSDCFKFSSAGKGAPKGPPTYALIHNFGPLINQTAGQQANYNVNISMSTNKH